MRRSGDIRIGISGWRYKPWRGVFYPEDLTQKDELAFASRKFRSIEINGTFYSLQRPEYFAGWAAQTPDDFVFSVKAPRYITHILRLKDSEEGLANFFASGISRLGDKLGPILWQLPPSYRFDPERLSAFLKQLPHNGEKAAVIAKQHASSMKGRVWTKFPPEKRIRHALEIRNNSFKTQEFIDILRRYDVALVCADTVEWPRLMDVTSDFVYCRLHGSEVLYSSGYTNRALALWARRAIAWSRGEQAQGEYISERVMRPRKRNVFIYFDNDAKVRAPFDAQTLMGKIAKLQA